MSEMINEWCGCYVVKYFPTSKLDDSRILFTSFHTFGYITLIYSGNITVGYV